MRIKKIKLSGFDRLYEGYKEALKDKRGTAYTTGLFDFLNHNMIAIEADELTTIELFYLKKLASSVSIIEKTYDNFVGDDEADLKQKIDGLLQIHDELVSDDDIDKNSAFIDNILPIGCEMYHVLAVFKGSKITSITGALIDDVFKENGKFPDKYPTNDFIENTIAEKFYKSLYTFMSNQMQEFDIVSNFMTVRKFYQYADEIVNIAHVNTPFGEIIFFGKKQDDLNNYVQTIVDSMHTSPFIIEDEILLTYIMKTSFSTFMKLFLNTNYVVDHENLKIVFTKEYVGVDETINDKYSARIENSLAYLESHKKGLAKATQVDLNKFNYIFNGNEIIYSIQIPYSKIEEFCDTVGNNITEIKKATDAILQISKVVGSLIGV